MRWPSDREDASSMVTAGAKLTPQRGTVAHLGNQGCCVHIHTGNLSLVTCRVLFARAPVIRLCFYVSVDRGPPFWPVRRAVADVGARRAAAASAGGPSSLGIERLFSLYVLNRYSSIPVAQPHEYEYRIPPG